MSDQPSPLSGRGHKRTDIPTYVPKTVEIKKPFSIGTIEEGEIAKHQNSGRDPKDEYHEEGQEEKSQKVDDEIKGDDEVAAGEASGAA